MEIPDSCDPIVYLDPNVSTFVLNEHGPRCADESIVKPTVIIYACILFCGVFGNICTCLVILRNKTMQTPTNYYLFSLAVSDLLMLILGLPVELHGILSVGYPYQFNEFVCKLRAFLIEFTSYASILTITSFSLERWLAICFPLRAKLFSTCSRAINMIFGCWVGAFIAAIPVFFIVVINKVPLSEHWSAEKISELYSIGITLDNKTIEGTEFCALDATNMQVQQSFLISAFMLFFLLPALVITAVYLHILFKIHQTDRYLLAEQQRTTRNRKSLIRMLGYFYYANSACNPILYNIMSTKYRRAFCKTILCRRCSNHCYKKVNLSTYSKHRQSMSRQSAAIRTRSLSRNDTKDGANKKFSVDLSLSNQRSIRSTGGRLIEY